MIFDKNLILSGDQTYSGLSGQAHSLSSSTAVNSDNVIDLIQARDLSASEDLYLYIKLLTTFTPATSVATALEINLVAVDSATDGGNSLNYVIAGTGDNYIQNLNAKGEFILKISPQFDTIGRRYLMLKYWRSIGTETVAGSVFAGLTMGVNVIKNYPSATTII